jgi:hypothetical protein
MNTYKVVAQRELGEWVAEVDVIGATQARRPIVGSGAPSFGGVLGAARLERTSGPRRAPRLPRS